MKIAFINPPFLAGYSRGQRSPAVTKASTLYYPYWLALAAGWAQKKGFEVQLYDFVAEGKNHSGALKILKNFSPQIAVLETSTPSIINDIGFAKKIKGSLKNCFVVLVGTHVSAMPEWTLKQAGEVEAVAVGEYDATIVELGRALENNENLSKVKGLVFRKNRRIFTNPRQEPIKNLDDFPFVSEVYKQFLDPQNYYFAAAGYPMVMIITGRGCPFGCFYCLWPQTMHGLQYRSRSAKSVVEEFIYIKENMPETKEILIEDDTFTTDIKRVQEICRMLIRKNNTLKWATNARVHLDLETMRLMRQAGCRLLIVGYESGSQRVLDGMDKKIKLADSLKFAENARKAKLLVHGCFMVGNPGETSQTMRQTLEFAKKLDPDSAQFYPLFVYPGTRAFQWAQKNGYLKTQDFRKWLDKAGGHNCVIDLPDLSAKEMVDFCNRAYFNFHFRPKYFLKKVIQLLTDPYEGARSVRTLLRVLAR